MLQRLRDRRLGRQADQVFDVFNAEFRRETGQYLPSEVRSLSDIDLHELVTRNELSAGSRSMMEREIKRREAWDAPAGKAFWISIIALAVSLSSLLWTVLNR